jgi:hypothetical protein
MAIFSGFQRVDKVCFSRLYAGLRRKTVTENHGVGGSIPPLSANLAYTIDIIDVSRLNWTTQ